MSTPETPSIGDVVDANTSMTADLAASQAAAEVAASVPPPSGDTTVIVEPETTDTTAQGLDAAAHMKSIAREECDLYMTELVAYQAALEAKKAEETPEVVVIQAQTEQDAPPVQPEAVEDPPPLTEDEAPPMAKSHPYFRPIRRRKP